MSSDKQDNKEFGQLGDIAKKLQASQGEGGSNEQDLKAQAAEAYGKFEKLSDKEKEDLVKGGLGKLEETTPYKKNHIYLVVFSIYHHKLRTSPEVPYNIFTDPLKMSSQNTNKPANESTNTTAENNQNSNNNNNNNGAAHSELDQQDLNQIQDVAKKILNPNNENPQMNEYIQSTMSYIGNMMHKMQTTNDKDATAKEIADDLTTKFNNWKEEREKNKKEETNGQTSTEEKEKK
ncbi:hypothetical protein CANMA_001882 [Candida margitis]|uniref:uncharacterized protein n=1 Tax=Candida margitis TaxID=1775924 RepID=UPI0022268BFE|nr:uncharacterized protein CANMA_001882 [Candida margitis]KAI5969078.1 hypothetical protein CANMA_001882 [Candida margitis]